MDDGVDDDGAPAAASATLSFSMRMAIPCDGRASYFLTQAQGGRWGLIDVGTVYKRAGLGGDRWTRSSVAVSLRGGPGALGGRNTTATTAAAAAATTVRAGGRKLAGGM